MLLLLCASVSLCVVVGRNQPTNHHTTLCHPDIEQQLQQQLRYIQQQQQQQQQQQKDWA
jgi:hypothetical protein